jgi:DNA-binding CsgD family transcriptional regulator
LDRLRSEDPVPPGVLDLLPEEIALLNEAGTVIWANAAWLGDRPSSSTGILARSRVGETLVHPAEASGDPIASGIRAVLGRRSNHFELELTEATPEGPWRISATRLPGGQVAVIVKQGRPVHRLTVFPGGRGRDDRGGSRDPLGTAEAGPIDDVDPTTREDLTPREREVLALMMRGLDNREISRELGISYTSVRAHVRSLIGKLGAASRLEAVAGVYRRRLRDLGGTGAAEIGSERGETP